MSTTNQSKLGYRLIGSCSASWMPTSEVASGMVTALGIVLGVERCAPEHGGGILVNIPSGNYQLESDDWVLVVGILSQTMLTIARKKYGKEGHDYSTSIR